MLLSNNRSLPHAFARGIEGARLELRPAVVVTLVLLVVGSLPLAAFAFASTMIPTGAAALVSGAVAFLLLVLVLEREIFARERLGEIVVIADGLSFEGEWLVTRSFAWQVRVVRPRFRKLGALLVFRCAESRDVVCLRLPTERAARSLFRSLGLPCSHGGEARTSVT